MNEGITGVAVGVAVAVGVLVGVFVGVLVGVLLGVGVNVGVAVEVAVGVFVGVAVGVSVGVGVGPVARSKSHSPRPWVAIRRTRLFACIAIPNIAIRGSPLLNGIQFVPPSDVLKTPISVPAYTTLVSAGSMAIAFTGVSGMPRPAGIHVGLPDNRFVVFQICSPVFRLIAVKVPQGGLMAGYPSLVKNLLYPVKPKDGFTGP